MADNIVSLTGQLVTSAPIEDRFALAFAPAKPTFDALAKLRKVRNHLAERRRYDPNCKSHPFGHLAASERLGFLPDAATLAQARHLFHEAEHIPAPEEWLHLAFGAMLAAAPNSGRVPVDYQFGLVDLILNDEELHRGYDELGFSMPVVVLAIREVRRECKYVPSAQELLEACQKHRRAFRDLAFDVDVMIEVRDLAELALAPSRTPAREPSDDHIEIPF